MKRILLSALVVTLVLLGAVLAPDLGRESPPVRPAPGETLAGDDPATQPVGPVPTPPSCVIQVRDEKGRPCRAGVFATGLANRPPVGADYIGITGEDGRLERIRFEFEPRGSVFARSSGRVAPPVPFTPAGADLVLGDGVVVTGTVRDKEGQALFGVVVFAGLRSLGPAEWTVSDTEGRFRLTGLFPGAWEVEGRTESYRTIEEIEPKTWDETIDVELSGFLAPKDSVLVDVRYSSPPEALPQLILRGKGRPWTCWLPPANAVVRVDVGEERTVEVVCPGFKTAKARLHGGASVVRLDLDAGGGMPRALKVVDPAGLPVPGALVLLTSGPDDHYPNAPRTGPDGRLDLSAAHLGYHAVASADAGASERVRIEEGSDEIVLTLRPAGVLTGRVVEKGTGLPVPGATLRLMGGDCACCSPWSAVTDENGEYRFAGIPAGQFVQVYATGGPGLSGTRTDLPGSHAEVLARGLGHLVEGTEATRFSDIEVTRYASYPCRFRIEPALTGERVRIENMSGGTYYERMDEDGTVSIEVRAGKSLYLLQSGDRKGIAWAETGEASPAPEISVRLEEPPRVTAVLVPAGEDRLPFGRFWVKVEVVLRSGGESHQIRWGGENADYEGRADLTGDLLAAGPPGVENVISVEHDRFHVEGGPIRISVAELRARVSKSGGEVVLEIPLVAGGKNRPFPVIVVNRQGVPVPGVRIGDPGETEEAVVTDADGRANVRPDWGPLFPHTGDWNLYGIPRDPVPHLVAERARRVRLRFLGPEDGPVVDGWVDEANDLFYEGTDEDGRVELILPVRIESIAPRLEGWWLDFTGLLPEDGEVSIRAVRRRYFDVVVRGPKETAVERQVRILWEADAPPGTEAEGSDRAEQKGDTWRARVALPPFSGRLRAVTSNLRYEGRVEAALGTKKVEIELARLPEHEVVLLLTGPDGRPLANREVEVDRRSFTAGMLVPDGSRTDDAGRLVLRLPEGPHELHGIEVGDLTREKIRFSSPAGDDVEVRLK